jgi:hypothetical protein
VRQYAEGPVTLVANIEVEYGHFEEYIVRGSPFFGPRNGLFKVDRSPLKN